MPNLAWVDDDDRNSREHEYVSDLRLVASTRLENDTFGLQLQQALAELLVSFVVVRNREAFTARTDGDVQSLLRHIDSNIDHGRALQMTLAPPNLVMRA